MVVFTIFAKGKLFFFTPFLTFKRQKSSSQLSKFTLGFMMKGGKKNGIVLCVWCGPSNPPFFFNFFRGGGGRGLLHNNTDIVVLKVNTLTNNTNFFNLQCIHSFLFIVHLIHKHIQLTRPTCSSCHASMHLKLLSPIPFVKIWTDFLCNEFLIKMNRLQQNYTFRICTLSRILNICCKNNISYCLPGPYLPAIER